MKVYENIILNTIKERKVIEYNELLDIVKRFGITKEALDIVLRSLSSKVEVKYGKIVKIKENDYKIVNVVEDELLDNLYKLVVFGYCDPHIYSLLYWNKVFSSDRISFKSVLPIIEKKINYIIFKLLVYKSYIKLIVDKSNLPTNVIKNVRIKIIPGVYEPSFYGMYKVSSECLMKRLHNKVRVILQPPFNALVISRGVYERFLARFNVDKLLFLIYDESKVIALPY